MLEAELEVPFVWHVKESPHLSIAGGTWPQLVDLHTRSDAQIYAAPRSGLLYGDLDDLAGQLDDADAMHRRRDAAWNQRDEVTFDAHADGLIDAFRVVAR